jgi:hypothetical protein
MAMDFSFLIIQATRARLHQLLLGTIWTDNIIAISDEAAANE